MVAGDVRDGVRHHPAHVLRVVRRGVVAVELVQALAEADLDAGDEVSGWISGFLGLVDTDKVALSSTLDQAPWERTTVADKPAAEIVGDLKETDGGDILVLSSASVIKALLAADKVDRLALTIFPVFLGGGPRLFDDGLPAGQWSLVSHTADEHGTLALVYDGVR